MIATVVFAPTPSIEALQSAFLTVLPAIRLHARLTFRHIRCTATREDYIAETVALAWQAFVALARRGKDARPYVRLIALCCAQAVKAGHRLADSVVRKEVLSDFARERRDQVVEHLSDEAGESATLPANGPWVDARVHQFAAI